MTEEHGNPNEKLSAEETHLMERSNKKVKIGATEGDSESFKEKLIKGVQKMIYPYQTSLKRRNLTRMYGHSKDKFPMLKKNQEEITSGTIKEGEEVLHRINQERLVRENEEVSQPEVRDEGSDFFGPWMLVTRLNRYGVLAELKDQVTETGMPTHKPTQRIVLADITNRGQEDNSKGRDYAQAGFNQRPKRVYSGEGQKFKVDFIALVETHQHRDNACKIIDRLGFQNREVVEVSGQAGGIWCLWNDNGFHISCVAKHAQYIHFKVSSANNIWFLTIIYGNPQNHNRRELWRHINEIGNYTQDPWCLIEDFNAFLYSSEKFGGSMNGSHPDGLFRDCIDQNALFDLGFLGPGYTWKRGNVVARLDKAIANDSW
ncbi:uncharacterized protein G2W53_014189 [Senna tora]|uniref:Endonuclease/exonuclease/phosphatase domain-containing protein n=1 Tax=Senna tora TaxID=362788 RepID=A0A835C5Z9_9FABA|nr:uncharacterized protein G2W53_014189 [Senna tora]